MSNTPREDVIKLAREAGFGEMFSTFFCGELEHLCALAVAKAVAEEREACAKVCEEFMRLTLDAQLGEPSDLHNVMLRQIANLGHGELAAAIRARSNT